MKKFGLILVSLTLATTSYANPFFTDDADVIDTEKYSFELSFTSEISHNQPNEKAGEFEFKYGLILETEFSLTLAYEYVSQDRDNELPALKGLGDSDLSLKYRLFQEGSYFPALAIAPKLGLPTGNRSNNLSNQRVWYELPLWFRVLILGQLQVGLDMYGIPLPMLQIIYLQG